MFRFRISRLFPLLFFCFSLSRPLFCVPARMTAEHLTVITAEDNNNKTHNATWREFTRFLDAEPGSRVTGICELKKYFHRFGYLSAAAAGGNFSDVFDTQLQSAVVSYQKRLGLSVTGKLDSDTISAMAAPRCGVSDVHMAATNIHAIKHYAFFYGEPRWSMQGAPINLTYAFSPANTVDYLTPSEIRAVFKRSFARWSAVIPVNFTEASDFSQADIRIGFYGGDHGDGEPFDGVLGVLAHAFSPENGRFHLDKAETWSVDFEKQKSKVAVDLESVATHEIGHVLGLAHSSVKEAVMYPSLSPRKKKVNLTIDDVEGVQELYGSNPNFKLSSLLVSENSSNWATSLKHELSKLNYLIFTILALLFQIR